MFTLTKDILIKEIEIYTLKIPLNKPIKMAGIIVDSAENLFVKIISQNDTYGWGEASSAPTMTGEFSHGMFSAALFLKNFLINKNLTSLNDLDILKKSPLYENKGTKSAFEIALLDLMAKENNIPLFQLFASQSKRHSIPIIKMVAGKTFFEQPIKASEKNKITEITALSSVPTCSDEGVHSINDVIEIGEKSITSGLSLKTIKLGGAYEAYKCGEKANELGLNINLSGKVAETSIASFAISHVAQAITQANWDLSITNQYLVEDPVTKNLKISNGQINFENTVGLGTELDISKASKFIQQSS